MIRPDRWPGECLDRDQLIDVVSGLHEGLVPADGLPLSGVSRPHPLQGMLDPERVIDRLHTGLPFETYPAEL